MAVGHFSKIFDPGQNGQQLADDSVTRLKNEFAASDPNIIFYIPFQDDNTERSFEMCSLEMFLLNANASDKVITIADTRHMQRWSAREVDPMLCEGDLAFFCNCPATLENLRLWAHERTPGIPRNVDDLGTVEFADVLGAIAEDQHLTRCAQERFRGTEERLTKFWEIKTRNKEEMLWKKPIEKLTCLNRCLYLVTQNPRKNV